MKKLSLCLVLAIQLSACSNDEKNTLPRLINDRVEVQFEQGHKFSLQLFDAEQDPITVSLIAEPKLGTLTYKNNNQFYYQADTGQTHAQQMRVLLDDGKDRVEHTVTLTIKDDRQFQLSSSEPKNQARLLPIDTKLQLNFNSAVQLPKTTFSSCSESIKLIANDGNCLAFTAEKLADNKSIIITPKNALKHNHSYRLMVTSKLNNFVATALEADSNITFTTGHQDLIISEIKVDHLGYAQRWFELYNGTDKPIALKDYRINTQAVSSFGEVTPSHAFSLGEGLIAPGQHIIVQNDTFEYQWQRGFIDGPEIKMIKDQDLRMFWHHSGYLSLTKQGDVVDAVYFGSTAIPTNGNDWQGQAFDTKPEFSFITRDHNNSDTNASKDWQHSHFPTAAWHNDVTCQLDDDQDGIPDCSEVAGSTYAGLPLYDWGAAVGQKDIFVEIDHMKSNDLGVVPQLEAVEKLIKTFNQAGFALHVDAGNLFDHGDARSIYNLGGGSQVRFAKTIHFSDSPTRKSIYQYKHQHFAMQRSNMFHYLLFANSQNDDGNAGSSGYAEINGDDALITLGGWGLNRNNEPSVNYLINMQAATMLHELGHNFGLYHGGKDGVNYKPNHLSVMNYMYQLNGLPTIGNNEGDRVLWRSHPFNPACTNFEHTNAPEQDHNKFVINYSHGLSQVFDEAKLDENIGFGHPESKPVDFNCSGKIEQETVTLDYNNNDYLGDVYYDHNEWDALNLSFHREDIPPVFRRNLATPPIVELTPPREMLERIKLLAEQ